jgi:spoIIIJ-associated protein
MSTSYPQQAEQTFVELVNLLGMTATTTSESKERGIYIKVDTPEPGRLIGRKGQTLQSIQYLLNVMVQRRDSEFPRVFIDIADDARREPRKKSGERRERGERRNGERKERGERRNGERRESRRSEENPVEEKITSNEPVNVAASLVPEEEAAPSGASVPEVAAEATATPPVDAVVEPSIDAPVTESPSTEASAAPAAEEVAEAAEDGDWRPSDPAPERKSRREERPQRRRGDLTPEEKARKQTTDAIKEVRRWGESVKLPPLTVEMRKVVLEVLEEYPDVIMEGELDEHVERKRVTLLLAD